MDEINAAVSVTDIAILEELRTAWQSEDMLLFVGSHLNEAAGFPSWRQLVQVAIDRMRDQGLDQIAVGEVRDFIRRQQFGDALAAAQHALGNEAFATFIEDELDDAGRAPPKIALALSSLRHKLRAVITITLNHSLERAFGPEWKVLSKVSHAAAVQRQFILKLHGTLKEPHTWTFTQEHLVLADPSVRTTLAALLTKCPVLFVGLSRTDDPILHELRALAGDNPPPHFLLMSTNTLMPYRHKTLVEMGFRIITYDNTDGLHEHAIAAIEHVSGGTRSDVRLTTGRSLLPQIPELDVPQISPFDFALESSAADEAQPISIPSVSRQLSKRVRQSEPPASPIEVFFSYSDRNRDLRDKLERHLAILKRKGVIRGWHEGEIGAGEEWDKTLRERLDTAKIILLLISADFLASDFCYQVEMRRAIERHDRGDAVVIPVLLDACDWEPAPFGKLKPLPKDGLAVTSWQNESEAFANIAKGIRTEVEKLTQNPA